LVHAKAQPSADGLPAFALGRPTTELDAVGGTDALTNGQDGIEVVVVDQAGDLPLTLTANYPEFPDGCPGPGSSACSA
jgi:hypothetical protein